MCIAEYESPLGIIRPARGTNTRNHNAIVSERDEITRLKKNVSKVHVYRYTENSKRIEQLTLLFNARSLAFIGRHLAITFTFSDVIVPRRLHQIRLGICARTYLFLNGRGL